MIAWAKGGTAEVTAVDGEIVTLRSTVPTPPGMRLEGTLDGATPLKLKSHGSKKEGDHFVFTARLLDATRDVRALVEASVKAC
jgi:hypothetical protein